MLSRRATMVLVIGSVLTSGLPAFARGASFQAIDRNRDGMLDLDELEKDGRPSSAHRTAITQAL